MTLCISPEEIFANRKADDGCVRWPLPETLSSAPEVVYRNAFAVALSLRTPQEIVSSYVYLTADDMQHLVNLVLKRVLTRPLAGYGLNWGRAVGCFQPSPQRIHGCMAF